MADKQTWSADSYGRDARFVSDLGADVVTLLAPKPGERILDLGCGDGALTEKIAAAGAEVVAVDSSPEFIAAARTRGLDARLMDGEALTFSDEFDAVFSNAALHWMRDAGAVLDGVSRALKPGGRFVAEFGGHGNVAAIATAMAAVARNRGVDPALAQPWYFPTPAEYANLLEDKGFSVETIFAFARPTPLPTGMKAWIAVFRDPLFKQFGDAREEALDEVEALLAPALCDSSGKWHADYVRLRVAASLKPVF